MPNEIINEFTEKYDFWFANKGKEVTKEEKHNQRLLDEFLNKFTRNYIESMPIDDYVVGKGKNSFCKWVETNLQDYGDIHALQLNAWQKFGIYYSSKNKNYEHGTRFGREYNEVYKNIIKSILEIVDASKTGDDEALAKSRLNPLFKNKIYYLYNDKNSLPIYSEDDINALLSEFGISFNVKEDRAFKRRQLFNFYKSLNRDDITTYLFMRFVYSDLGYRSILRTNEAREIKKEIKKDAYTLVDVTKLSDALPSNHSNSGGLVNEKPETIIQKKITGKRGEEIVKQYLLTHKKELEIAGDIDCACEYDDSKHYDFSYVDVNGNTIYIEVKSTKANNENKVLFEMSDKEYDFMKENIDNYYFYYVNDVYNGNVIKRISAKLIMAHESKYRISMEIN